MQTLELDQIGRDGDPLRGRVTDKPSLLTPPGLPGPALSSEVKKPLVALHPCPLPLTLKIPGGGWLRVRVWLGG